jgi:RimJ/RimL family protein N-acetyltransferase
MSPMMPGPAAVDHVTTARLVGRRPEPGDADAYVGLYGDPRTPEETVLLPGGEVIGHAGVQHTTIGDRPEAELLWFSHPDYWNRGYATEMAREAVRVAFDVLELDDVVSFTVHGNAASRAVMEKLGMTYERDVEHAGLPHVLYRLTRGR